MSSEQSSSSPLDDSRKRKLENVDDDDTSRVKIAKPSLGLSLLQSYDAEDDYMTSDEEPASPPSSLGVDSSVTRNVFIEEMTDEDQADENLTDHISPVNSEVADALSPSVSETNNLPSDTSESSAPVDCEVKNNVAIDAVDAEKSVDEPSENLPNTAESESPVNEFHVVSVESSEDVPVDTKISSSQIEVESELACTKTDSIKELEVSKIKEPEITISNKMSDFKNVDSGQTSETNETESKSDIRPDYNFSVFGTSSDIGSSDERVSTKPAKKVKLNRSKFIRSVDESSNEAKLNAVTSSPVLSSSETDLKPVISENSIPVQPNVEVAENKVPEEISTKPVEIIQNMPEETEDSADLDQAVISVTEMENPDETFDVSQSASDTDFGVLVEAPADLNLEVSEPPATSSNSIENDSSPVEESFTENLEHVPHSDEEIVKPKTSMAAIDSLLETEPSLVDEEIIGPTDIPGDEIDDNPHDNMIEVIDQDVDISVAQDENLSQSEVGIVEEFRNEESGLASTGEVKLSELNASEELKNNESTINAVEDLVEELMDDNSIIQESTNENILVEELENTSEVVEELTYANAFDEETACKNSFAEEEKDENSIIHESNENHIVDSAEKLENENPSVDMVDDLKNEKPETSPISFDADQEHSIDLDESPDEGDEKESAESTLDMRDTIEPPHRPLKIIIRKKEEKLVVEDVPRSKRRGRKSAKKLQKEKSKMKGEEGKKKIVAPDERADFEVNVAAVEKIGEMSKETKKESEPINELVETDDLVMKEEPVTSTISEIIDPTPFPSEQDASEPCIAAESDDEIFKDAMDTLEPESEETNFEKQAAVSVQSPDPAQSSIPFNGAADESGVSAVPINIKSSYEKCGEKTMKNEEPNPVVVSNLDEITNEAMEADTEEDSANTVSEVPSKLEQALTRKLRSDKNVESAAIATTPPVEETDKPSLEAPPEEPPPVKENLKLHLSVQGNRVLIKKNVAAESIVAPVPETTCLPSPVTDPEVPPPRVKRQYRKRAKPTIDPALLTEEKSYTLRTRNTKNPPEEVTPKKTKGRKSAAAVAAAAAVVTSAPLPDLTLMPTVSTPLKKEKVLREAPLPVTVEIDPPPDKKVTTAAGKVRPIRLKIKNPGVTIECTSKYSPVTIEKIGGSEKSSMSDNIVDILEEARKKESQATITQEQAAWSGTDLQRVERLLKESNITITPVSSAFSSSSAEPVSQSPSSILKPILTAAKEKSGKKSMHKAPLVSQSSSSAIGAASITPIFGDNKDTSADSSYARNLNVLLKPLDFEEQLSHWKISKPGREMDVTRIPSPAADQQKQQPVDVKMEIRKKIASSERRRQIQEPEVVITVDETTPNLEEVYQSRKRDEGVVESKPPVKEVKRKSRFKPAEITIFKSDSEVSKKIVSSAEEITCRLPSETKNMDEFILPDSTPPVEVPDTSVPIVKDTMHERTSQAEKPKLEAQATLESESEDLCIVEPEAEGQVLLEPKCEVQVPSESKDESAAVGAPRAESQVIMPKQADVLDVAVKDEIEILEHIKHSKSEDATTELTLKVENVEPVAKSKSEPPLSKSEYKPAETSTKVQPEALTASVSSSVNDVTLETTSGVTASPPTAPEVKQITPEPKPKIGKQMPDLLPISKPPMTFKSIQISPVTSQHAHMLTQSAQSQLASITPQTTSVDPQTASAVPSSPVAPQTTIPSQFVPLTPQIKLSAAPLTSKMLQEALAAPQSTPSQQVSSSTSFMGSPMGTPMSAISMTSSFTPRMVDSGVNTSSKSFTESTTPSYSNLPPLMFPKKRGRPTKAMVAAREAYRQSQEAMEGFKRQSTEPVLATTDAGTTPQPVSHGDEPTLSNITVDLLKLPVKRGRKIKLEKSDQTDGSDDNTCAEKLPMDPEREQEELKRLEEDRIRKEQERERKNELRRQKAKERSDLEKAKKLRQRQKAEERHKKVQEQRRLLQEQKKKLEEEIKKLPGFEAGRVTSADVSQMSNGSFLMDDDSNSMSFDPMQRLKKTKMEVYDPDGNNLTVDQIAEYQWPIQGGELYMIQEQISNFLGVKSFKRKYPDIKRRPVDSEERAYLVDSGLVSETLCDLGITAVCSAEVLDIMCSDFPEKYEELRKYMREKQMKELSFKQKAWANGLGYKLLMADGSKQDLKKRAMESVSNWNSALNKSRHEDRRSAIDLQTFIIHYPKSKTQNMTSPSPKLGSYPISILPGQFCDFYKDYTSTELRYLPVNTVIYGPVRHPSAAKDVDGSQTDSDDSSSSDESSSTTSEGTQATEDTLEDMDKDMSLDESSLAEKLPDTSVREDRDLNRREMTNGGTEVPLLEDGKILCKVCLGDETRNKENAPEVLIYCSQCCSSSHPTCLDLSLNMVPHIKSYKWQCPDCKNCARCKEYADEDKMLFCDTCDRGYHIYCVGLKKVPSGSWQCLECTTLDDQVNRESLMHAPSLATSSIPIKIES